MRVASEKGLTERWIIGSNDAVARRPGGPCASNYELWLAVAPTLLGDGVRLFDDLRSPIDLEVLEVVEGPRATHLRYRVRDGGG